MKLPELHFTSHFYLTQKYAKEKQIVSCAEMKEILTAERKKRKKKEKKKRRKEKKTLLIRRILNKNLKLQYLENDSTRRVHEHAFLSLVSRSFVCSLLATIFSVICSQGFIFLCPPYLVSGRIWHNLLLNNAVISMSVAKSQITSEGVVAPGRLETSTNSLSFHASPSLLSQFLSYYLEIFSLSVFFCPVCFVLSSRRKRRGRYR